jgi:hypothetical protein
LDNAASREPGIGLGIGFTSCLYFLLLAGGAAKLPIILGVELVALCAAQKRADPNNRVEVQCRSHYAGQTLGKLGKTKHADRYPAEQHR